MRCKHQNGKLYEYFVKTLIKEVNNGTVEKNGIIDMASVAGYGFLCYECERRFEFSLGTFKWPKWFIRYYEEARQ